MTSITLLCIALILAWTEAILSPPPKPPDKSPAEKLGEALGKYLDKGIKINVNIENKDK